MKIQSKYIDEYVKCASHFDTAGDWYDILLPGPERNDVFPNEIKFVPLIFLNLVKNLGYVRSRLFPWTHLFELWFEHRQNTPKKGFRQKKVKRN